QNDVTLKMPAFEWVHVQLHQQKGMISLSPPTICNSAERFEQLSSKEKRAEFREWKAGETERDQDLSASAPAEVEVLEIEETGPEPD
ncbi:hypothetical protein, partial [Pseudomonas aeruginosa]